VGIKLLATLAAATLALTSFVPVASATVPKPQSKVFAGHTSSDTIAGAEFVYPFNMPANHGFEVSWTSSPYPPGAHGANQYFALDVGPYGDPNSHVCDARGMWCSGTTGSTPASGVHSFSSGEGGHFAIGVLADEMQWTIKVIFGAVQPPGPPGIGSTINIPASVGTGAYAVQLVQVYNNYVWPNPTGDEVGTRPVIIKLKVSDTGKQTLTVIGESQVLLTSNGTTYQPDLLAQSVAGCPQQTAFGTLIPGTSVYVCVTFDFPTHIGLAGSKVWWTQFGSSSAPLYYWVLPAM
jgi:hypothetical protein